MTQKIDALAKLKELQAEQERLQQQLKNELFQEEYGSLKSHNFVGEVWAVSSNENLFVTGFEWGDDYLLLQGVSIELYKMEDYQRASISVEVDATAFMCAGKPFHKSTFSKEDMIVVLKMMTNHLQKEESGAFENAINVLESA